MFEKTKKSTKKLIMSEAVFCKPNGFGKNGLNFAVCAALSLDTLKSS